MSSVLKLVRFTRASYARHLSYKASYECPVSHSLSPSTVPAHMGLLESLSSTPTKTIENMMSGKKHSFQQIADNGLQAATKLQSCGVKPGDHVMLYSPNHESYMSTVLGIMCAGAVPCLANPAYTEFELGALCKSTDINFLIAATANHSIASKVSTAQNIPLLCLVDDLDNFISGSDPLQTPHQSSVEDVAVIGYSSGTTGLPKGVQLTHKNLNFQRSIVNDPHFFNLEVFDTPQLCVLPWYHAFGFTQCSIAIEVGTDVKTLPHFDPALYLKAIADYKPKMLSAVPPIINFLAKHPAVAHFDLSSVGEIVSGAAPLTETMMNELMTRHPNIEVCRQGYGMTEATCCHTLQLLSDSHTNHGSVGVPLPFCETRIENVETGEPILDGQAGEIILGGPIIMKGYYDNTKANAETLTDDGFVRTGDIGRIDENGILWITDRIKELIKVKGYQVAPAELEGLLMSHPLIADAAVIGIPDPRTGETPKAFVTPAPGASISEDDVKKFIEERLSTEKKLGAVEFIDAIPKLPSGKILRKDLRNLEESRRK